MTHGDLGGDPAADASPDKVELRQLECIENFEIGKYHVLDRVDVFVFVALSAAGVGGSDYARAFGELLVKWQPAFFHRMNIGEAMQIEQRRAVAVFHSPNLPALDLDSASAQWSSSADASTLTPGNSWVNCCKDCWRNAGATFSANSFMLLRARWSGMLPSWN